MINNNLVLAAAISALDIIIPVAAAIITGILCFIAGIAFRRNVAEKEIGSAEEEAKRIINESIKNAENKKRESLLEVKEEIHKARLEYEREEKSRRQDLQKQERRLAQKEENLDRKTDQLEKKEDILNKKIQKNDEIEKELEELKSKQIELLENISRLTTDEAKNYLLSQLETEVVHEQAGKLRELEAKFNDEAEDMARNIISLAIQKCAADHVTETAVSVVPIPSDDMKGRIIGREGRNIRTFETLTGVDLIIDDTPEAITLSAFDPVRREVARIALEKLIVDGRIHPARIEEMVGKATKEVEQTIKREGERAAFETNIHNLHPEVIKLLGRLHFRTSYGQNGLQHSIEVSHIAGLLAAEIGADITLAKRAGLLHDLGKAVDHEMEGSHVQIGIELAKKYKENQAVIHAIHAHHGDVEPQSIVACLVQAADAVSAARPGARRENIETYIKRLEKLEEIANTYPGVQNSYAVQAGREIRIMAKPDEISDDEMIVLARKLSKKIEDELEYPGQIKVHVIRETRAIEYAK
jgi:ribonuclease Y